MHNNAVHTRRTCEKKKKTLGFLVEYRLNFHCFGVILRYYHISNIVANILLIPGRNLVQSICFSKKENTRRGHSHVKWITPKLFLFFCWTTVRSQLSGGIRARLLRMHNNAVHTRRTCQTPPPPEGKKKKGGGLVEYRLNFHCFGGAIWLLAFRQHCNIYSDDSWTKLGPDYSIFQ